MASACPLAGTPFYFLGPRPYREAELAAYIRREHARRQNLVEILNDPYLGRYGQALRRAVLRRAELLGALRQDITDTIRLRQAQLRGQRSASPHEQHTRVRRSAPVEKMLSLATLTAATALLVAAGASATGQAGAGSTAKRVVISTRTLPKLGTVLVNSEGRTLYMFVPDKRKRVTCVKTCAAVWPPVKLVKGAKPVAKGSAKAKLLGSDPNPAGGRVVTYNHWPLYTYVADTRPGQAKGQALNLNGDLWYVLSPSGRVIRKKA